ncbi:MAG TPA: PF20097 family protein [Thermoanaerobaculia bacterium]|nr:PF20097 family protein [Thermoanaerobaculia bacterium]
MDHHLTCPKCSAAMEKGVIVDYTHGAATQAEWAEGEPKYSIWTGLKLRGHERHRIVTYRCTRCGYLESYAPTDSNKG